MYPSPELPAITRQSNGRVNLNNFSNGFKPGVHLESMLGCSNDCGHFSPRVSNEADHLGKRSRSFIFQNLPVDVRGTASMNS